MAGRKKEEEMPIEFSKVEPGMVLVNDHTGKRVTILDIENVQVEDSPPQYNEVIIYQEEGGKPERWEKKNFSSHHSLPPSAPKDRRTGILSKLFSRR